MHLSSLGLLELLRVPQQPRQYPRPPPRHPQGGYASPTAPQPRSTRASARPRPSNDLAKQKDRRTAPGSTRCIGQEITPDCTGSNVHWRSVLWAPAGPEGLTSSVQFRSVIKETNVTGTPITTRRAAPSLLPARAPAARRLASALRGRAPSAGRRHSWRARGRPRA